METIINPRDPKLKKKNSKQELFFKNKKLDFANSYKIRAQLRPEILVIPERDKNRIWNYEVTVTDLRGGHFESVPRDKCNAIKILSRLLLELSKEVDYSLMSLIGGNAVESIPVFASARISVTREEYAKLSAPFLRISNQLKAEYHYDVPCISFSELRFKQKVVYSNEFKIRLLELLLELPSKVDWFKTGSKNKYIQTLCNLGIIQVSGQRMFIETMHRSITTYGSYHVGSKYENLFQSVGAKIEVIQAE